MFPLILPDSAGKRVILSISSEPSRPRDWLLQNSQPHRAAPGRHRKLEHCQRLAAMTGYSPLCFHRRKKGLARIEFRWVAGSSATCGVIAHETGPWTKLDKNDNRSADEQREGSSRTQLPRSFARETALAVTLFSMASGFVYHAIIEPRHGKSIFTVVDTLGFASKFLAFALIPWTLRHGFERRRAARHDDFLHRFLVTHSGSGELSFSFLDSWILRWLLRCRSTMGTVPSGARAAPSISPGRGYSSSRIRQDETDLPVAKH
jgi:hypothetical protein